MLSMAEANPNIAVLIETTPALVFSDRQKADELFAHIEQEITSFVPDLSTEKGRKAVASLAYKVSRTKTAIDDAGAGLIEAANKQVKTVNAERKRMRDHLDMLRDKARKPLDDWEAAQAERKRECEALVAEIKRAGQVAFDETSATLGERIAALEGTELHLDFLGDFFDVATDARDASLATLRAALQQQEQLEAERAELARLRKEQEARAAQAEENRRAREEAERQASYIEAQIQHIKACGLGLIDGRSYPVVILRRELEEKVVIDDTFGDRKGEAEAARSAALKALAGIEEQQRLADEAAEGERRRLAEEETQRREREAAQRVKDEAEAEQRRKDKEAAERAADQAHRDEVLRAAEAAVMSVAAIGKDKASKIVLAIAAGSVPNTTINF